MPTGYTADIANGITFKEYALRCARNFGALIMMRDEPQDAPIPDKFEPSAYHAEEIVKSQNELRKLKAMKASEWTLAANAAFKEESKRYSERIVESKSLRKKYEAMLAQALAYIAPSPDHQEYRSFMISQIEKSIDWDCDEKHITRPERLSGKEWMEKRREKIQWSIDYHTKEMAKEIERTNAVSLWIKQLKESLA